MSAVDKRHGPSISLKMILTTTLLIIVIVAGFGLLNIYTLGRVYDSQVTEAERLIRDQLSKVGASTVVAVSSSTRSFLESNNDADLRKHLVDLAKKDPTLAAVYVLDANLGLVAHSDEAKSPKE